MFSNYKDVFVIHSKDQELENTLATLLIERLKCISISVYEYPDWEWKRTVPGELIKSSWDREVDPALVYVGHPEPFLKHTAEEIPDRYILDEMFRNCRVIVLLAPRSAGTSEGVFLEMEEIPQEATLVLVSLDTAYDEGIVNRYQPGYVYSIAQPYSPNLEKVAHDLTLIVWLHWVIDHLALECKEAGRSVLANIVQTDTAIHRVIDSSGRMSQRFSRQPLPDPAAGEAITPSSYTILAESITAQAASPVLAHWYGQAGLVELLPSSKNPTTPEVDQMIQNLKLACSAFCDAAIEAHPELIAYKAEGLRTSSAVAAEVKADREWRLQRLEEALALPNLPDAVRSRLLADRAEMWLEESPELALGDIETVLALSGAAGDARAHVLWLRAECQKLVAPTAALHDLSEALEFQELSPRLRALCRHNRAMLYRDANEPERSLDDLNEVLKLRELPADIIRPAQLDRAVQRKKMGNIDGALADYTEIIDSQGEPNETSRKALMDRGLMRMEQNDRRGAYKDFVVIFNDPAASQEEKLEAKKLLDECDPLK